MEKSPAKPDGKPPAFMRMADGGVYLSVKVQPRASRNDIDPSLGEELRIRVTAPPVDAAANAAVLELLADKLDCPRNAVRLVRGQTNRHKLIYIHGLTPAVIGLRLFSRS
jgi:uncharacterized protein (TIGR00251 family)